MCGSSNLSSTKQNLKVFLSKWTILFHIDGGSVGAVGLISVENKLGKAIYL